MTPRRESDRLMKHLARWLLAGAVRHWPAETRAWGQAVAAELEEETMDAWESLSWSLGGVLLFFYSLAGSLWAWLHLPVGASLSRGAEPSSRLPKCSRFLTLATLAAAGALLFLPLGQQALNTFRSSWSGFVPSAFDGWQLDRLGRRAEIENDPSALAFASQATDDPGRFLRWADRAVSIDPQYVWIYGAARTHGSSDLREAAKRLERLRAADPDNAVPALLEASLLSNSRISELYERYSPQEEEVQAMLEADPNWVELMQRAFAAPRYDSYLGQQAQLVSAVWNRKRNLSPSIVLTGLWGHPMPDLAMVRAFSRILFRQAEEAAAAGDFPEAERQIGRVGGFGERMAGGDQAHTNLESLIGVTLERDAAAELQKLYAQTGRPSDAGKATSEMKRLDDRSAELRRRIEASGFARMHAFRSLGFLVQGLGVLLVLAALLASAALLVLEIVPARFTSRRMRLRTAASWATDYAPAALLVSSGAFLLSFLPYARVFAQYRSSSAPLPDEHPVVEALWGLGAVPVRVLSSNYQLSAWLAFTVALSALAVFLVARGLYRWRRVPAVSRS
jgi:hypothetical protein